MTVLTNKPNHRKHAMEELHLLSLRFRCFMSKAVDVNQDELVQQSLEMLLNQIKRHLPSDDFQSRYMNQMGIIGFDGRFALHINHDMTHCTLIRTSSFSNVYQFQRGGA